MSASHATTVCSILLLASIGSAEAAEGGRLRAAGEALRDETERPPDRDHEHDHERDHHHHHDGHRLHDQAVDGHGSLDLMIGVFVGLRAISIPAYHRHPYDRQFRSEAVPAGEPEPGPQLNGRFALLGGGDGAELRWLGLDARVVSPIGLGIGGEWLHYLEDVAGETVEADLFDGSLVWRGLELPYGSFDCTLGYLGFHDEIGTEHGAHVGLDLVAFPLRPLVLEASASWGGIDHASVQRYRLAAGATWQHASLSIGYRWTDIGRVDLDGWEARFGWWF